MARAPSFRPPRWGRVVVVALVLLVGTITLLVGGHAAAIPQPIAFNHRKHTKDIGLACPFCHQYVTTSAHAGLPRAETCALCHRAKQGTSAEAARLTELLAANAPLRFNKLFRLPTHVNYTHRRHVGIAQLECSNCHGAIAETTQPPPQPLVRIRMSFCLSCHRARGQSVDCIACHR